MSARFLRRVFDASCALAALLLCTALSAMPAQAAHTFTLYAGSIAEEQNVGWNFPDQAKGSPTNCSTGSMASQPPNFSNGTPGSCGSVANCRDQWLEASSFDNFTVPADEVIDHVWVDVRGGTNRATNPSSSGAEGFNLRVRSSGATIATNTVTWSENSVTCGTGDVNVDLWRFGNWPIDSQLQSNGLFNEASIKALALWVQRSNGTGKDLYVDAFRIVVHTIKAPPPAPNLSLGTVTANSISINWSVPASGGPSEAFFVDRNINNAGWVRIQTGIDPNQRSYQDTQLQEWTHYDYRVTAFNSDNIGAPSQVGATTKNTPNRLAFTAQLPETIDAVTTSYDVTVEVRDSQDRLVPDATTAVALSLTPDYTPSVLAGDKATNAAGGVATFHNVRIKRVGSGYQLIASADLPNAYKFGNPVKVIPGPAFKLSFVSQPHTATAGQPLGATIEVRDAENNKITTATNTVTLQLVGTCGGSVTPNQANAGGGTVDFSNAWVDSACVGYQLLATASGLSSDTSTPFDVTPGSPAKLVFRKQPAEGAVGQPLAEVDVAVADPYGNTVPSASNDVTVGFAFNGCNAVLDGGQARTASPNGIAKFTSLQISKACGTYQLNATAVGLAAGVSSTFDVVQFQATGGDLLAGAYAFDDPDGSCHARGWSGEPQEGVVYAHISNRFPVSGGGNALWFGADSTSAPTEVANWVSSTGYGNNWSQRLVSPTFQGSSVRPVLSFDATIDFTASGGLVSGAAGNEFLAAQVLDNAGKWRFLNMHFGALMATAVTGQGALTGITASLAADGNESIALDNNAQVRIVVQTDSLGSSEDGGAASGRGAVVIDNVQLKNGTSPVAPALDFNSGLQTWTLKAANGLWCSTQAITRDLPARTTTVQLQPGTRFGETESGDPTCVWSFLATGDTTAADGEYARLRSPWLPRYAPTLDVVITFSARLNSPDERRSFKVYALGRNTGDTHPRWSVAAKRLQSTAPGGDATSGFQSVSLRYPADFAGSNTSEFIQFAFETADVPEADANGINRPLTQLPLVDDIQMAVVGADTDQDGVADATDACNGEVASGHDADGNGCLDRFPTSVDRRYWAVADRPIHYAFTITGDSSITNGSEFTEVRRAIATWQSVTGASFSVVEDPPIAGYVANSFDGVNEITWTDALTSDHLRFPEGVLALTSRTTFTRQSGFNDRLVRPGQIVDSDIRFNPDSAFSTGGPTGTGSIADARPLYDVALHEFGHVLGLPHSIVVRSTMYPAVGAETSTLEDVDRSALASRFPVAAVLDNSFGSIEGRVISGKDSVSAVVGARVLAQRLVGTGPQVSDTTATDYTDAQGNYHLWRLPPANYAVRVEPITDFEVAYVDSALGATAQTNFTGEWWNASESNVDPLAAMDAIAIAAGQKITGRNVVTNKDFTAPTIIHNLPQGSAVDVEPDAAVVIDYSEPVDFASAKAAFSLTKQSNGAPVLGRSALIDGTRFTFIPYSALEWGTPYNVTISPSVGDLGGNVLAAPYPFSFTTRSRGASITLLRYSPNPAPPGAFITISGDNFDVTNLQNDAVTFSNCGGCGAVKPIKAASQSILVQVPSNAGSGTLSVGGASLSFTKFDDPSTLGPGIAKSVGLSGYDPRDVALTPDGAWALVASKNGLVWSNGSVVNADQLPGALDAIALSPATSKAYAIGSSSGRLYQISAATGTIGQNSLCMDIGGQPAGLAVRPDGRAVYVTDLDRNAVHEIDVSTTPAQELRRFDLTKFTLTGAIAVEVGGDSLLLDTRELGGVALSLITDTLAWRQIAPGAPASGHGGIAETPQRDEILFAGGALGVRAAHGVFAAPPATTASVAVGPLTTDVAMTSGGHLALVADPGNSRVAIVGVNAGAPSTYHTVIGSVYVSGSAVALDIDPNGTQAAVVSSGAGVGALTLIPLVTSVPLQLLSSPAAIPGDILIATTGAASVLDSTQVQIGDNSTPVTYHAGSSLAFKVPPLEAQIAAVSVVPSAGGSPTGSLPLRVVPRVPSTSHEARAMSVVLETPVETCGGGGQGSCPLRVALPSPGGDVVAMLTGPQLIGACTIPAKLRFWQSTDSLGKLMRTVTLPGGRDVTAATFSPDGQDLWIAFDDGSLRVYDTKGNQGSTTVAAGAAGHASALAMDPFGRYVVVAAATEHAVFLLQRSTGTVLDSVAMGGHTPLSMACSRDGHMLIIGGDDRAWIYDLATLALLATSPSHPGQGLTSLAVLPQGDRVAGLAAPATIGVWNLDPARGALGAQQFFTPNLGGGDTLVTIEPAPDSVSVLACVASHPVLHRLRFPTNQSPTRVTTPIAHGEASMARSSDGRLLWAMSAGLQGVSHAPSGRDSVRLYGLLRDSLVQIISGAGQSAVKGSVIQDLRVRVADGLGNAAAGLIVEFSRRVFPGCAQLDGNGDSAIVRRFTDVNGIAGVSWKLRTSPGVDTVKVLLAPSLAPITVFATATDNDAGAKPVIVATGPDGSQSATPLLANSSLFVTFNQQMRADKFTATVTANGDLVPGSWSAVNASHTMVFQPERPFPYSASCQLTVPAGLPDQQDDLLQENTQTPGIAARVNFTIEPRPSFAIEYLQPQGAAAGGIVNVVGRGFLSNPQAMAVLFGDRAGYVIHASSKLLEVQLPDGLQPGAVSVRAQLRTSGAFTAAEVLQVLPSQSQRDIEAHDLAAKKGGHSLALVPGATLDGALAYVVTPSADNVHYYDVRSGAMTWLQTIAVGHVPIAISIHPNGDLAYVANAGSNDISVIDINPGTQSQPNPKFNAVIKTIPLPATPLSMDIATTSDGEFVLVVTDAATTSLLTLDGRPSSATLNTIITQASSTSGSKIKGSVAQDGGLSFLYTDKGVYRYNLAKKAVDDSLPAMGHVTVLEIDRARRGLIYGVTDDGNVRIVDVSEGGGTKGKLLGRIEVPGGAAAIKTSSDGTLIITSRDADRVFAYTITRTGGFNHAGEATGDVVVGARAVQPTGHLPVAVAVDPRGGFALIANEGSTTATRLDLATEAPIEMSLDLTLDRFDLSTFGQSYPARVEPPADSLAAQIDAASVVLADLVPADVAGSQQLSDVDHDGIHERSLAFPFGPIPAVVPTGSSVAVAVTGSVGAHSFVAHDTLRVRRGAFTSPQPGGVLPSRSRVLLTYDWTADTTNTRVVVMYTVNGGRAWKRAYSSYYLRSPILWTTPDTLTDSAQVAVIMVDSVTVDTSVVRGTLAISGLFHLSAALGIEQVADHLQLAPVAPNPARGMALIRFALPHAGPASIAIHDIEGRLVQQLAHGTLAAGWHDVRWRGESRGSSRAAPGVYYLRLEADGRTLTRKFVYLR